MALSPAGSSPLTSTARLAAPSHSFIIRQSLIPHGLCTRRTIPLMFSRSPSSTCFLVPVVCRRWTSPMYAFIAWSQPDDSLMRSHSPALRRATLMMMQCFQAASSPTASFSRRPSRLASLRARLLPSVWVVLPALLGSRPMLKPLLSRINFGTSFSVVQAPHALSVAPFWTGMFFGSHREGLHSNFHYFSIDLDIEGGSTAHFVAFINQLRSHFNGASKQCVVHFSNTLLTDCFSLDTTLLARLNVRSRMHTWGGSCNMRLMSYY